MKNYPLWICEYKLVIHAPKFLFHNIIHNSTICLYPNLWILGIIIKNIDITIKVAVSYPLLNVEKCYTLLDYTIYPQSCLQLFVDFLNIVDFFNIWLCYNVDRRDFRMRCMRWKNINEYGMMLLID